MLAMTPRTPTKHDARTAEGRNAHTPATRDAALRRLARAKRWLLAGTAALTGVLAAVAAGAFPGKSVNGAAGATTSQAGSAAAAAGGRAAEGSRASEEAPLQTPEQQPQGSAGGESSAAGGGTPETPVVSGGS